MRWGELNRIDWNESEARPIVVRLTTFAVAAPAVISGAAAIEPRNSRRVTIQDLLLARYGGAQASFCIRVRVVNAVRSGRSGGARSSSFCEQ
jgi:hypothetical protein